MDKSSWPGEEQVEVELGASPDELHLHNFHLIDPVGYSEKLGMYVYDCFGAALVVLDKEPVKQLVVHLHAWLESLEEDNVSED